MQVDTSVKPRRMRLRLVAIQLAIVLCTVLAVALVVLRVEEDRGRELAYDEVRTVAQHFAGMPEVAEWINRPEGPEHLQPLATLARETAGVAFVVVADDDGMRVTHPDPERVGEPVSSGHEDVRAGATFEGMEEGPLGVTFRSKVPVWDGDRVVGSVSVGVARESVRADLLAVVLSFAPWILGAAGVGTVAAALAALYVRRRIYGADPDQMPALLQSRQALLHSVGDAVVGVAPDGAVALVNDEAGRLLGTPQDAVGRPAEDVLPADVASLLAQRPGEPLSRLVLTGERVLLARVRPAHMGGRVAGWTLTAQDRTELRTLLRQLEGQRGLAETLRAQTHEFNNRLHVLSGLLSFGDVDEARRYLEALTDGTGGAGRAALEDASAAALVAAKTSWASEAGVRLQVAEGSAAAPGRVDEDVLTVLSNLVTNAVEAAGDGGRVEVWLQVDDDGTRLRVDDSGPGTAGRSVAELVRWGVSSKENGPGEGMAGGRGVGLALVDRIVARRGGVLQAGDGPRGGARFEASWPDAGAVSDADGADEADDLGAAPVRADGGEGSR